MEARILEENSYVRLFEEQDEKKKISRDFLLEACIGTGASCVAYKAIGEDGIPVKLKQFHPYGINSDQYRYFND